MKPNVTAILLMVLCAMLIPFGDALAKYTNEHYGADVTFLAWSRFAVGAVVFAPFAIINGARFAEMVRPWVLARAIFIAATISLILQAAAQVPLADAYGAFFVGPIISFVLAVVLLKERAGIARWVAISAGFGGVLLVVRPSLDMHEGMIIALLAGVAYGSFLTTNRYLSRYFSAWSMLQSQLLVGSVVLLPFALPFNWGDGSVMAWSLIVLSATTSIAANLFMVMAYVRAEATKLAPLIYVQVLAATSYGIVMFGGWPDPLTWAGLAILVASGAVGLLRQKP